uniref:Ig-like domain-containing protein n=1 Tax=Monopterus albus TaxID=43700 RepID=A0A3Q3QVL7_MONAL
LVRFSLVFHLFSHLSVREGDDVTLPCESLRNAQSQCDETRWLFVYLDSRTTVVLVRDGQIERREISSSKSNRLSVTEKCSLVMKKVTFEDVGRYTCKHRGQDSLVELFVVISEYFHHDVFMTEQKDGDKVTLSCYVSTFYCRHKVKWLYQGQDVDKNTNLQTSQSDCQATLSFLDSHFISPSRYKLLTCEVTNDVGGKVEFSFRRQTSGEKMMSLFQTKTT